MGLDDQLARRIRALCAPRAPIATEVAPVLGPLAGIRAVLFDVYGTLFVSASGDIGAGEVAAGEDPFARAMARVFPEHTPPGDGVARLGAAIRAEHARRRADGVEYPEVDILAIWRSLLAGLPGAPPDPDRLRALAVEYECLTNPVWPMPGLAGCLEALRDAGLVLGIVSNAQLYTPLLFPAFVEGSLAGLGFDPACAVFSYRLREAKPSTRLYREAIAALGTRHGIAPSEVLYVGNDMLKDVWPAARCGLHTALFAADQRSLRLRADDPRCAGLRPERVVTELAQIAPMLAR